MHDLFHEFVSNASLMARNRFNMEIVTKTFSIATTVGHDFDSKALICFANGSTVREQNRSKAF